MNIGRCVIALTREIFVAGDRRDVGGAVIDRQRIEKFRHALAFAVRRL